MSFWNVLYAEIVATPALEWLAFLTGVGYVILAAYKNILCWIFAFISSAIFIYLCFQNQLYIESSLQVFYVVMAVYGYYEWKKTSKNQEAKNKELPIIEWSFQNHLINIIVSSALVLICGSILFYYTDQKSPYLDAFTTFFSLTATYMVAKRILSNWIYWIVIDIFSMYLYYTNGLKLSALLYLLFTLLAGFAWFKWYKNYKSVSVK